MTAREIANAPSILLEHRHQLIGECLANALTEAGHETGCVTSIIGFFVSSRPAAAGPTLCIFDAALPLAVLTSSIEYVHRVRPNCKTVLLVSETTSHPLGELAPLPSHGCICDDETLGGFCTAISVVLAGDVYCSPHLARTMLTQLSRPVPVEVDVMPRLTSREAEILQLISEEKLSNKQLARRLHVSLYTVKNHVHNIIEKLGVDDRHAAAEYASRRRVRRGR